MRWAHLICWWFPLWPCVEEGMTFVVCWHINSCLPLGLYWAFWLQKHNTDFYWRFFFFFFSPWYTLSKHESFKRSCDLSFRLWPISEFLFFIFFMICGWQDFCPPTEISPAATARPPAFAPPAPPSLHTSGPFHLAFPLPCPWQGHLSLWNWKLILRPFSHRLLGPGCGEFPASSLQTESSQLPQWVQKTVSNSMQWFPFL